MLAVIAVCHLIVLDASIVNIALPQAQRALNISEAGRHRVVTAYALAIAATATAQCLITRHAAVQAGLVHGYRPAFAVSAIVLAVVGAAASLLIRARRDDLPGTRTAS